MLQTMTDETKNADIVDRLRGKARNGNFVSPNLLDTREAADLIERQRDLLAEVLACIDGDDYLKLTMMYPRLDAEFPDAH